MLEQNEKALSPMKEMVEFNSKDVKLEHLKNAHAPIDIKDEGMSTEVSSVHFLNAKFPIVVIPSSIVTVDMLDFNVNQGATIVTE
jgi:hypothetical protein